MLLGDSLLLFFRWVYSFDYSTDRNTYKCTIQSERFENIDYKVPLFSYISLFIQTFTIKTLISVINHLESCF